MRYHEDKLTETIIDAVIRVHTVLGPGFLEYLYRNALIIELKKRGLNAEMEKEIIVYYEGTEIGRHRLDLLVEGRVILELKTVADLAAVHYAQIRSYLKATGAPVGLLVNFAKSSADFRRVELHTPDNPE